MKIMKKQSIYALIGAIALVGAVGFSSCSSSNDEVINNPNYDPETNSVKTEFTISLPDYVGSKTRQTDAITQAQSPVTFRGMQDLVLIPYNAAVEATLTPLQSKVFNNLGEIASTNGWDKANQKAKVYKTLDVPVGTKTFMFYGQATPDGTNFNNGKLNAPSSYAGAASTYGFSLETIAGSYTSDSDVKGNAILAYLQGIRQISGLSSTSLVSLLTNFKPTAASSASIQAAVQALWDIVLDADNGFSEADINAVKTSILGSGTKTATIDGTTNKVALTGSDLTGYPANLYLPDGAVTINWADSDVPQINGHTGLDVIDLTKLVYPAALYYRANSTIGVSATETVSNNYGEESWETISNTSSTTYYTWNGTVDGNTRSIALHDQIQYAVGRLDLKVAAENSTLYDANGTAVSVNTTDGFPISAILIGGQKNVGYDFTPGSYTGTVNSYTIYDNVMNGTVAAKVTGTDGGTNRTLVLETASSTLETGACKQVNVAVEMTNNTGAAFRGKDGDVPAGGKFYLVGVLDIDNNKTSGDRTKIFEQDFITTASFTIKQGTPTTDLEEGAKNTKGLGAAYNVIPDLTISNLEVAFSVDLTWQSGLTFNVEL